MPAPPTPRRSRSLILTCALALGCSGAPPGPPDGPEALPRVPVTGVVTRGGKPLGQAVVTFLPATGPPGVAETDADGRYALSCLNRPGIPPGEYKVAVSYLVSADGAPQGLGPRSSMVQSPGMLSAREQLPREFSDLGRTSLTSRVGPSGATLNIDVPDQPAPGTGPDTPRAEPPAAAGAAP